MSENSSNSTEPISNENVARILALLRTGDEKIGSTRIDNAILIVGKSGSGKTTLTNFLAGNNADLISEELGQDTGEYIIRDKNNKISDGNSTIISKTIFPELVYDSETKTVLIDAPGFNDRGRNEAYDIAAACFIRKVLKNVKNVKIVLTANHPSLRSGVSRDDFPDLLERVTTLIKNIDRYVDSVALIATKVDNAYTKRKIRGEAELVLVPDKLVIENIAKFLSQVENSLKKMQTSDPILKSNSTLSQNELFYNNSQKLLDALLRKKGSEYTRLGLFRRPDAAGPISKIELLQEGKKILKNMLKNNLEYAPIDASDIGYAVSDKSKNIITQLVSEINKNIVTDMSQINDILIDFFRQLENNLFDDSIYVLKEHLEAWSIALAKISAIGESAKVDELVSLIEGNITEFFKRAADPLLNDMKKLGNFMDFIQDVNDKQFESFAWKWVAELREAVIYVENSLKWYNFLIALYDRLSDQDVQKDTKRFHVPKFESKSGCLENFADFSKFFFEISNSRILNVQYLKELQKVTIDVIKVRYFDRVIESTLQPSVNFSEFNNPGPRLQVTGEYVKISDVIQHSLYPGSKSVQVLATHTVFIDADMTKENDISIIAPRWVIIGSRVINLNGSRAKVWYSDKASNGLCSGCSGKNGLPGEPGKSAGHFFGLGDVFENASQLQIQAVGGSGGGGQHGGDGAKGATGLTYNIVESKRYLYCPSSQSCSTQVLYRAGDLWSYYDMYLTLYGTAGGRGGDAGRGGAPGLGGFAGNVTVIGVGNENPLILQNVAKGNDGEFGLHGKCGEGGEGGYNKCSRICVNCSDRNKDSTYDDGKQPDGEKGTCLYYSSVANSNLEGRAQPAGINFFYPLASLISDFRNELVKNFANCIRKSHSKIFYEMLQKEDILKYDNVDVIFSEFRQLQQYSEFPPNFSKTLYESLLKRIEKISTPAKDPLKLESGKPFDFLSSAVISKLTGLEKNQHARLPFNHREYFDVLKTTDVDKISRYFVDRASKDIEQTENLVEIVANDIYSVIERSIYKISSSCLNDDLDMLQTQLLKLKLFSKFKTTNEFLSLAIFLAKLDLDLIHTMRITNTIPSVEISLSAVDGSMINSKLAAIKKAAEKEADAIEGAILNEIRSLQSLGDEFDLAADQLQDAAMNLKSRSSVSNKSNQFSIFSSIVNEIKTIDGINFALLKNFGPKVNATIDRFEKDLKIIQWNVDLFAASTTDEFDRPSLTSAIDSIREKGANFSEIAREVFHSLEPVLITLRNGLTGDLFKTEDIKKLRVMVSDALSTIKWKFYQMTSQVEIDEDLQIITQNFDEVLNRLSTIFNEVLPDQHHRAILKNLHSQLKMREEPNNELENYLTKMISADQIFYEYKHLVDAYKTSIFPFDVLTNRTLTLPVIPQVDESLVKYQTFIADNIKQLEVELDSWQQSVKNVTIAEDFSISNENGAFFAWRYDQYKESISKLLRGRAVVLKASLDVGDKRQWLKFDNIGLRFVSSNSTVQQSLDEDLKYFNVSMTHMGNSYFSLCNRVRLVNQDATQFIHNFNESTTQVVDPKTSSLKPVLSPFATWMLKLHPIDEDVTFSILNPYRKLAISIELEGNATFVDSVNITTCQKIVLSDFDIHQLPSTLENDHEIAKNISGADQSPSASLANNSVAHQLVSSTEISSTHSNTVKRKKRDIGSSSRVPDNRGFNWWNPFNYFSSVKPNSKFELPSKNLFLGRNEEHSTTIDYSSPLNINGALALIDFVVRNITKIKPYRSMEKSMSAEEARVIALNIIEELENMLSQLPEEKHVSLSDWQEKDPVELVAQLEKNILTGDLSSVKEILFDLVPLDIPDDELDSLLGRHLGSADIRGNFENHRSTVVGGRGHLFGVMDVDFADQAGILSANSFNQTALE